MKAMLDGEIKVYEKFDYVAQYTTIQFEDKTNRKLAEYNKRTQRILFSVWAVNLKDVETIISYIKSDDINE